MGELTGRVALVLGAGSSGAAISNGEAAARAYARAGAIVAAIDRDGAEARRVAEAIGGGAGAPPPGLPPQERGGAGAGRGGEAIGGDAVAITADVTREDEVAAAVDTAVRDLGAPGILHNNVGLAPTGPVTDIGPGSWNEMLAVNLTSAYLTCRHTLPHMLAAGRG